MKKYELPVADQLKEIKFKFEFDTIKDAFTYVKKFVKKNKQELIQLFFPGLDPDEYKHHQSYKKCDKDNYVLEIVKTKSRITKGEIRIQDYMWVVPPWLKDNKSVLMNVYQNKLEKYMIDTKLAFYDQSYFGISRKKAFKLVLYNEVLRLIIKSFPSNPFGKDTPSATEKEYEELRNRIYMMRRTGNNFKETGHPLLEKSYLHNAAKLEYSQYELLFSGKQTVLKKARRSLDKILNDNQRSWYPSYTSIQEKENVITQYLKLQTHQVRSSKNSRGKGSNAKKKQSVILYRTKNPKASISEIARKCKVDRKTVRKYLKG